MLLLRLIRLLSCKLDLMLKICRPEFLGVLIITTLWNLSIQIPLSPVRTTGELAQDPLCTFGWRYRVRPPTARRPRTCHLAAVLQLLQKAWTLKILTGLLSRSLGRLTPIILGLLQCTVPTQLVTSSQVLKPSCLALLQMPGSFLAVSRNVVVLHGRPTKETESSRHDCNMQALSSLLLGPRPCPFEASCPRGVKAWISFLL
jgi:hypothetical protein